MPFMAALPAITAGAGLLGKLFGGAAKGSADQRYGENNQRLNQAQIQNQYELQRAQTMNQDAINRAQLQSTDGWNRTNAQQSDSFNRAHLDLNRRAFSQQEPDAQAMQALRGSLLSRIQPMQMSGLSDRVSARMPKMNSIIDAIGPDARQAGSLLAQRGLSGLQSGPTQFDELPALSLPPDLVLPPALNIPPATLMALQKSGLLEKIMGGLGLAGSVVGGLGALRSSGKPTSGNGLPIDEFGGG